MTGPGEADVDTLNVPKSEVTGDELIQRITGMVPALRERQRAAEEAGRIPEETIGDLKRADLFRAIVPKRYGGHEVDFKYIPQIFRELGRGCISTGWTMGFLIYHNFQFGHYPVEAQDEVWGGEPGYTMAAGQVMPSGTAERVDGGFRLTGRWGYATGILHGDYMALAAPVADSGDPAEMRRFFVPAGEFKILDTWDVSAMAATGSHDVELDGTFVPERHSVLVSDLRDGRAPGLEVNADPVWRVPLLTFMVYGAVGPLMGGAEAVCELVCEVLEGKTNAYSYAAMDKQMSTRVRMAQNQMTVEAARRLFDTSIQEVSDKVARGHEFSREERIKARMVACHVARTCHTVVNDMAREAGSRAIYNDSLIQRFQRDTNALATHAIFDLDHVGDIYGGVLLGQEIPPNVML